MELSRESRIVRWAYFTDDYGPPRQTSLCALFWRVVIWTPARMAFAAIVITAIVSSVGYIMFMLWPVTLTIATIIGAFIALDYFDVNPAPVERLAERAVTRIRGNVLVAGVKAVKSRACPLVTIKGCE